MIWFTADQHFDHDNVRGFCNRPFATVTEMNDELVAAWNRSVKPTDAVYHLADFTLSNPRIAHYAFSRLNGLIHIVAPSFHHDRHWLFPTITYHSATGSVKVHEPLITLVLDDVPPIALCHFPLAQWDRKHYGAWHLHGHSHGNYHGEGKILDVGVDNVAKIWGEYRPVGLDEVEEYMKGRGL